MSFQITVQITPQALQMLMQSGQSIGNAFDNGNNPNIIWTTQKPAPNIAFPGPSSWGLFASNSSLSSGSVIEMMDTLNSASAGKCYPFTPSGFGSASGTAPDGTIGVQNQSSGSVVLGLFAANNPATATSVPSSQSSNLAIPEVITFFVTQSPAGCVLGSLPGQNIQVNTQKDPNATLTYDVSGWSMQ